MISLPFRTISPLIAASILSADFSNLKSEIEDVLDPDGADFLHLDIMDGHFVPNISFGPAIGAATRRCTAAFLDTHLMITDPIRYAPAFLKAGVDAITFHVEVAPDPAATAQQLRQLGCKHVGITLNPPTPIESIYPALDHVDHVLVMSVNPGFLANHSCREALPKCEQVKTRLRPDQRLEIDGGIHADTIASARSAGVDWFVVASAIFDAPDRKLAISTLRQRLGGPA